MRSGSPFAGNPRACAGQRPFGDGAQLRRSARKFRSRRASAAAWRPNPGADRGDTRPRRGGRCRRGRDIDSANDHAKATGWPHRRALSLRAQYRHRKFVRAQAGLHRQCARGGAGFPANVNVAAALALAGIGPERTTIEIWADPSVSRNVHMIEVEAEAARFSMQIENVPSAENPKTGRLTPLSVVAALKKLTSPLAIGT